MVPGILLRGLYAESYLVGSLGLRHRKTIRLSIVVCTCLWRIDTASNTIALQVILGGEPKSKESGVYGP